MTSTTAQHSAEPTSPAGPASSPDSISPPSEITLPAPRSRGVAPLLVLAWVIAAFGVGFAVASLLVG